MNEKDHDFWNKPTGSLINSQNDFHQMIQTPLRSKSFTSDKNVVNISGEEKEVKKSLRNMISKLITKNYVSSNKTNEGNHSSEVSVEDLNVEVSVKSLTEISLL